MPPPPTPYRESPIHDLLPQTHPIVMVGATQIRMIRRYGYSGRHQDAGHARHHDQAGTTHDTGACYVACAEPSPMWASTRPLLVEQGTHMIDTGHVERTKPTWGRTKPPVCRKVVESSRTGIERSRRAPNVGRTGPMWGRAEPNLTSIRASPTPMSSTCEDCCSNRDACSSSPARCWSNPESRPTPSLGRTRFRAAPRSTSNGLGTTHGVNSTRLLPEVGLGVARDPRWGSFGDSARRSSGLDDGRCFRRLVVRGEVGSNNPTLLRLAPLPNKLETEPAPRS